MKNLLAITLVFILSLFVVEESRGDIPDVILKCGPLEDKQIFDELFYDESIRLIIQNRYFLINSKGTAYHWYFQEIPTSNNEDLLYKYYNLQKPERNHYQFIVKELIVRESDDMKTLKFHRLDHGDAPAYFEIDRSTLLKTSKRIPYIVTKCEIVDMTPAEFKVYFANQLNQVNEIAKDRKKYHEKLDKKREERKQEAIEEQLRKNKI